MKTMLFFLVFFQIDLTYSFELDFKSEIIFSKNKELKFKDIKTLTGKGIPIHENLILESVLAANLPGLSYKNKLRLINDLVIGVRWNDDPLNMFREHLVVGGISFFDSCRSKKSKKINVNWDLFYRSHCGDMQFLHSMASKKNEESLKTYNKMISWMEFSYKTSTGASPTDLKYRSLQYRMSEDNVKIFKEYMISPNGGRSLWRAEGMFSLDCTRTIFNRELKCDQKKHTKETTRNIALGSLLHILQDSFSVSHTMRNEKDKLKKFGLYNLQNKNDHTKKDQLYYKGQYRKLITVSAKIIETVIDDRYRKYIFKEVINLDTDSWELVREKYIDPIIYPVKTNVLPDSLGV